MFAWGFLKMTQTSSFKRMKLSEFRDEYFAGDRKPSTQTIINHIKSKRLSGENIGGHWYVHVHPWGAPIRYGKPQDQPAPSPSTGNKLADRILKLAAAT